MNSRSVLDCLDRPSGAVLPLILRQKLKQEHTESETTNSHNEEIQLVTPRNEDKDAVFTAEELEERLIKASSAVMDIQRQLTRGEEMYFEETHNHGNLFRGWDAFVDAKDTGSHSGGMSGVNTGNHHHNTGRRIPIDNRWFSSSCESASTTMPKLQSMLGRAANASAPSTTLASPPSLQNTVASAPLSNSSQVSTGTTSAVSVPLAAHDPATSVPKEVTEENTKMEPKESQDAKPEQSETTTQESPEKEKDEEKANNERDIRKSSREKSAKADDKSSDSKTPEATPPARRTTRKRKAGD